MKGFPSARSDSGPDRPEPSRTSVARRVHFRRPEAGAAALLAAAYLAAHLPFLAPSLEDIDSINFALGLRDFDVASHQPHPPGYGMYIALGRVSLAAIHAAVPAIETVRAEALALSVWSAVAGAVAIVAAWALFGALGATRRTAGWAAALLGVAPLFWISGLRPMSDLPGLAAALSAQVLILRGAAGSRQLLAGAFIAGLAAGLRVQTLLLTLPLLAIVLAGWTGERRPVPWRALSAAAAVLAGVLVWLAPTVAASGGVDGYLSTLAGQAGEDFAWVDMLWSNPTPRRLAQSVYETFVLPWGSIGPAVAVGIAAAIGAAYALAREQRAVALLAVAFGPYLVFHLLLQETVTVRYALPLLPAVAWFAARGALSAPRAGLAAAAVLVAWAGVTAWTGGVAYGREPHPAFRAIADLDAGIHDAGPAAGGATRPGTVFSHYALRRPLQARAPRGVRVVEPRTEGEWLDLVDYWLAGKTQPVWFMADPRRTDLDSIDPHARDPVRYRWSAGGRWELSGTRPIGVDLYRFDPPGWFAGRGWSLTPETAGQTRASATGLAHRPIEAYVRRGQGPMHLVVGGGYVGAPRDRAAIDLSIDGVAVATWTLAPEAGRFLEFVDFAEGLPGDAASGYATLVLRARPEAAGGPPPAVAIRQFDIQPAARLISAFGDGWHDEEYDNATGRRWRWTSGRAIIRVSPPQAVRLTLRGESPLRYFDTAPHVRVTANGRTIASFEPAADFEWDVTVPAGAVAAAGGAIALETDRVYRPADTEGTGDSRQLGLRMFEVGVHPVSP